uniref:Uncharacterized protein n=1 Tax=Cercocebus atys TaxID=9531 RepID=A0A2K5MM63_CERAT
MSAKCQALKSFFVPTMCCLADEGSYQGLGLSAGVKVGVPRPASTHLAFLFLTPSWPQYFSIVALITLTEVSYPRLFGEQNSHTLLSLNLLSPASSGLPLSMGHLELVSMGKKDQK